MPVVEYVQRYDWNFYKLNVVACTAKAKADRNSITDTNMNNLNTCMAAYNGMAQYGYRFYILL